MTKADYEKTLNDVTTYLVLLRQLANSKIENQDPAYDLNYMKGYRDAAQGVLEEIERHTKETI
mgnify:CR=1 FL=1